MNNSSAIIRELQELRKIWRVQNFVFSADQQARYDELTGLRRAFVQHWKEEGRVWIGPSNAGKKQQEEQEDAVV